VRVVGLEPTLLTERDFERPQMNYPLAIQRHPISR
jgi:hypothetical protein